MFIGYLCPAVNTCELMMRIVAPGTTWTSYTSGIETNSFEFVEVSALLHCVSVFVFVLTSCKFSFIQNVALCSQDRILNLGGSVF